jgi:hypothetical protein
MPHIYLKDGMAVTPNRLLLRIRAQESKARLLLLLSPH